jgi:hypothetical protein
MIGDVVIDFADRIEGAGKIPPAVRRTKEGGSKSGPS